MSPLNIVIWNHGDRFELDFHGSDEKVTDALARIGVESDARVLLMSQGTPGVVVSNDTELYSGMELKVISSTGKNG